MGEREVKVTEKNKSDLVQGIVFTMSAIALAVSCYAIVNQEIVSQRMNEIVSLVGQKEVAPKEIVSKVAVIDNEAMENYIMDNPTIIIKSLSKLRFEQEQKQKQAVVEKVKSFENDLINKKTDPVIGNPNGKHVVVEFIDNNCGYCKQLAPVLEKLIEIDPEAKVIVKEFPIFDTNPSSHYSALIGTAIYLTTPEKYPAFHKLTINTQKLNNDAIDAFAEKVGAPVSTLSAVLQKADQLIQENRLLGNQLEVSGTPTLFINGQRMNGGMSAEELKALF